jgi:hypothetical protein
MLGEPEWFLEKVRTRYKWGLWSAATRTQPLYRKEVSG